MKKQILNHSTRWMTFAAILILGLSAGASLAEATLFVPFWKSLDGNQFFSWYQDNKARLVAFYSPMQIWSAVLALFALLLHLFSGTRQKWKMMISALFAFAVLATFFIYFKEANAMLAARPMPDAELLVALNEWEVWQWIRIGLATMAFAFAVGAASEKPGED